jgi:hypothetical protein
VAVSDGRGGGAAPDPQHGLLEAIRSGWHGLGGGTAEACPGCPVCRLTRDAGRLDPEAAAHLQAAAGHVVAAGRELLAALEGAARGGIGDAGRAGGPADAGGTTDPTGDPVTDPGPARRTIPVETPHPEEPPA